MYMGIHACAFSTSKLFGDWISSRHAAVVSGDTVGSSMLSLTDRRHHPARPGMHICTFFIFDQIPGMTIPFIRLLADIFLRSERGADINVYRFGFHHQLDRTAWWCSFCRNGRRAGRQRGARAGSSASGGHGDAQGLWLDAHFADDRLDRRRGQW